MIQEIEHCTLQPREREIILTPVNLCLRERYGVGVAAFCRLVDLRATRVSESDRARHLVKSLSGCIVARPSEHLILTVIRNSHKMRVTARDDKTHERRFEILMFYIVGTYVPLYVMDPDKRQSLCKRYRLGLGNADKERADKSRAVRNRNGRNIIERT